MTLTDLANPSQFLRFATSITRGMKSNMSMEQARHLERQANQANKLRSDLHNLMWEKM